MMSGRLVGLIGGLALLAGCTATNTGGVVALGPDLYGMKVASRDLGGAAERGLTDATSFCNGQGRQTQLLRTQITNDDYQLVFRCTGSAPVIPRRVPVEVPSIAGFPIPDGGPVLAGPALGGSPTAEEMARLRMGNFQSPQGAPIFPAAGGAALGGPTQGRTPSLAPYRPGRAQLASAAPGFVPATPAYLSPPAPALTPQPFANPSPLTEDAPRRGGFFSRLFGSDEPEPPRGGLPALPPVPMTNPAYATQPPLGGGYAPASVGGGYPALPPGGAYAPAAGRGGLPPVATAPGAALGSPFAAPGAPLAAPYEPPPAGRFATPAAGATPIFPASPAAGAAVPPSAAGLQPLTSPLASPLAAPGPAPLAASAPAPLAAPIFPAAMSTPPPAPLAAPAPAPVTLQPLAAPPPIAAPPAASLQPLAPPPAALAPLTPATAAPVPLSATAPRALTPLPPVDPAALPRLATPGLTTNVPRTLPPPAAGGGTGAADAPPTGANVQPPPGFWSGPR